VSGSEIQLGAVGQVMVRRTTTAGTESQVIKIPFELGDARIRNVPSPLNYFRAESWRRARRLRSHGLSLEAQLMSRAQCVAPQGFLLL